jgi:hypothetical protein
MAELPGIQAVSRWFASGVQSSESAHRSYSGQDGAAPKSTQAGEQVFVQSRTQLSAVRYYVKNYLTENKYEEKR